MACIKSNGKPGSYWTVPCRVKTEPPPRDERVARGQVGVFAVVRGAARAHHVVGPDLRGWERHVRFDMPACPVGCVLWLQWAAGVKMCHLPDLRGWNGMQ